MIQYNFIIFKLDDLYPNLPEFPPKTLFNFNRKKLADERVVLFQIYINV